MADMLEGDSTHRQAIAPPLFPSDIAGAPAGLPDSTSGAPQGRNSCRGAGAAQSVVRAAARRTRLRIAAISAASIMREVTAMIQHDPITTMVH